MNNYRVELKRKDNNKVVLGRTIFAEIDYVAKRIFEIAENKNIDTSNLWLSISALD